MADVIVLCLGTNDAYQLGRIDEEMFREETLRAAGRLKEPVPDSRLILCLPPPVWFFEVDLDLDNVLRRTHEPIRQGAQALGAEVLDLHGPLADHPELFFDGVHPAVPGAERIGELVAGAVLREG